MNCIHLDPFQLNSKTYTSCIKNRNINKFGSQSSAPRAKIQPFFCCCCEHAIALRKIVKLTLKSHSQAHFRYLVRLTTQIDVSLDVKFLN